MVLPPLLTPRHSGGVVGLATVLQFQPPSQMSLQAYVNYAMGPPQVGFSFRAEPPTILYFYMFGVSSGICFLLSGAMMNVVFIYGGSTVEICTIAALWSLPMADIYATWQCSSAHTRCAQSSCSFHCFELGGAPATQSAVLPPFQLYGGAYSFGGLAENHPIPPPSLHGEEGSSFPGLVPSNDMVNYESVVGIKPCDSVVVIGYQVDEFTHT